MPSRTGCCATDYTTRSYNLDGTTRWKANYFQRVAATGYVTTQAVDSNYVYVGGTRETNGSKYWSVVCFDIVTGALVWDYDIGADCVCIRLDQSGNVICMVKMTSSAYTNSGTLYDQHFIRLTTAGVLIDDIYFTQVASVAHGGESIRTVDFSINSSGDYHVQGMYYNNPQYVAFYEWLSPFSSAPTLREISPQGNLASGYRGGMRRIGSRDFTFAYQPWRSAGTPAGGIGVRLASRGKSQTACVAALADFDLNIPSCYDATLSSVSVTCTGTTQAGAAALTANTDVTLSGGAGTGARLPTGATADIVGLQRNSFSLYATSYYIYPPTGGQFRGSGINNPIQVSKSGTICICISAGIWITGQDYRFGATGIGATDIAVDSGSAFVMATERGLMKFDSTGVEEWRTGDVPACIALDSSDNAYAMGPYYSYATITARDTSGTWLWGHRHAYYLYDLQHSRPTIDMDPDGSHVITSGSKYPVGPMNSSLDQDFLTDPDPYISFGRRATASQQGAAGSYTVGFAGGAAASGTTLVAVIADNSGVGGSLAISGGSSWTTLSGGVTGFTTSRVFTKICGGSEPATYSINYTGSGTPDSSNVSILEVLNAHATNPDDQQTSSNTATPASAHSSEAADACLLFVADYASASPVYDTAPTGFDLEAWIETHPVFSPTGPTTAIASQLNVGAGTITPGAWGNPDTTACTHWTVTLKKA